MKDLRTRFFFWLGIFVLPIFWSWFTLMKAFSKRQRQIAFGWLAIYGAAAVWNGPVIASYLQLLPIGFPLVIGWLTVALWAWLFFRLCRPMDLFTMLALGLVGVCEVFRPIQLSIDILILKGAPFSWYWLLWPLLPAVLHCVVGPLWERDEEATYHAST